MVLKFELESELEQTFREAAMKRFGYCKGSLKEATIEALKSWIMQQSENIPKVDKPLKLVDGILSNLKGRKTSVQLQHEVQYAELLSLSNERFK